MSSASAAASAFSPRRARTPILVVGDPSASRKGIQATLRDAGYEIDVVDGSEAVARLETREPGVIVLAVGTHVFEDVRLIDYLAMVQSPVLSAIVLIGPKAEIEPFASAVFATVETMDRAAPLLNAIERRRAFAQ